MTIKKKIFYTNTIMVVASLLILLGIGGVLISLFKDEFLARFSEGSEIAASISEVEDALSDEGNVNLTMEEWKNIFDAYEFRFYAENQSGKELYKNLKHSEWEAVEEINKNEFQSGQAKMYFMEGSTIVAARIENAADSYTIIAVSSSDETTFWGMDRGMFEMFIIIFLFTGVLAIAAILLCSQLFTRRLISHIMRPLDKLNEATIRIGEGNLNEAISYTNEDEFKPVCDSFDLMQENVKKSIEQQAAYERARTEMVSGISHDLRTPLTSIKGYIKGMLDGIANTEEKRQRYLSTAYKKSCDMDVLLSKLFYFSKLETGNMPFFAQKTDMSLLLENYAKEKETELLSKHVKIEMKNMLKQKLYCEIDKDQTKRVFDNLVENSIKYAKTEQIEIKVQLKQIDVEEKHFCEISFCDNGEGLETEKVSHVFEQFYRADEARNSKNDGNGLGLYVCKYIIEQQGGQITASGENGFCVSMRLPVFVEGES